MIKLKVLIPFFDIEAGFKRLKNSEFQCSKDRAKELVSYKDKLVEIQSICNQKKSKT